MREHRSKSGKLIYFATRHELEQLPGYRGNDRRGRACCPIHDGDNPTALSIDWQRGWASCWSCGDAFAIRIEDESDTGRSRARNRDDAPQRPRIAPRRGEREITSKTTPPPTQKAQAALSAAIRGAAARLPGSPGADYLERRGVPLAVAQQLQLGWGNTGKLNRRVVFPLCGPDGVATSAIGRTLDDQVKPKYDTLRRDDGYEKTLFNGAAIAQARQSGHPLVIVEGPMDAAACVAAGVPLAVAICGKSYAHPEHFAGLETVILALDADEAGDQGRRTLWLELTARGIEVLVLPAAVLVGAKDLCEYWQRHHELPAQIVATVMGPKLPGGAPNALGAANHVPPSAHPADGCSPIVAYPANFPARG